MISEILAYTNKYFPYTAEYNTFSVVADGIEGTFNETYLVGQYISILDSFLNDGVYKITGVTNTKLTLDAALLAESSKLCIHGLKLPKAYLSVISAIETYTAGQSTQAEISSESQGSRSVTYKDGSGWQSAFKSKLSPYMSMFDDRRNFIEYDINTKGW